MAATKRSTRQAKQVTPLRVMVTGCEGQLGYDVVRLLQSRKVECKGVDLGDFSLTDADGVMQAVQDYRPNAIVHCAAYTAVDKAESEPEVCTAVNGMGTTNLVRAALAVGAKLLYISTDYVFGGEGTEPFETEAPFGPQNVYGLSKMQGEIAVRSLMTRFYILRTS